MPRIRQLNLAMLVRVFAVNFPNRQQVLAVIRGQLHN
jgi:hypothetical protein